MQRERRAVTALFLANGALLATVLPRLPEIKADLELSDGQLGLSLLGAGLGGLAGSAASRWLLPRVGSRRLAAASTVALALLVPLLGIVPGAVLLFAVLVLAGVADAFMDVAMNVSGMEVFGAVGLGASSLFPALFSAAGALPGQGVAVMNAASRIGFLASPPVVGGLADAVGLPLALGLVVVPAGLGIALLARAVRPAAGRAAPL